MRQRSGRPLRILTSIRAVTSENWSGETPVEVTHMAGWFDAGPLLPGVDVLLSQAFTEEMAKAADSLKLIQSTGAGIEHIDLNVVPEGCRVAVVYEHEQAIGEWIIMAMIALNREALRADRDIREAKWEMHFTRGPTPRPELSGQTLGIIGLGHIGRKTAELAKTFGMRVIAATRTVPSDKERLAMGLDFVTDMNGLNIVLQESDFVLLSLPLTQGTQGLIGTEELSRMKSSGHLINVSRAGLVDEQALFEALSDGSIKGAARAGKHIFVEKPIAIELPDALETVRAVESAGVKFIHGTCSRLAPMVKQAKRMCPHPLYSYCQCTDAVTDQACHNIDLAVNLFHEAPVVRIYASGGQYWNLDPHLPADSFSAVLTFADGSTHTYIQHGRAYNPMLKKYHFQLFGVDGCVYLARRFKECHLMKTRDSVEQSWVFDGADMDRGPFGYMGHYEELVDLVDCIRNGGNGTMTVRDAAYILAVEKAILQSVETGQVIDFPGFLEENGAGFLLVGRRT